VQDLTKDIHSHQQRRTITVCTLALLLLPLLCGSPPATAEPPPSADSSRSIYELPELPLDLLTRGGVLGHSHVAPVITIQPRGAIVPEKPATPSDPDSLAHCPSASSHYIRHYITQVSYPRVTCYPNNAPSDSVLTRALERPNEPPENAPNESIRFIQRTQFFKLSAFKGARLTNPLFCTVHGGPWSAAVNEIQGCRVGCPLAPVHWRLSVHGFPDLELQWYGTWQDVPAHIHPTMGILINDLHLVAETIECCSGFSRRCPDGPCINQSLIDFEDLAELDCP